MPPGPAMSTLGLRYRRPRDCRMSASAVSRCAEGGRAPKRISCPAAIYAPSMRWYTCTHLEESTWLKLTWQFLAIYPMHLECKRRIYALAISRATAESGAHTTDRPSHNAHSPSSSPSPPHPVTPASIYYYPTQGSTRTSHKISTNSSKYAKLSSTITKG